ncbi:C40 family peptidase [Streptomyces sp. NBS 14/10]|uniref:C40 family peptidase n=1 Tax=Streptomyces sp. NBS 14/10 TaxID=1945643 RepID=UPI000B7D397E|nr:C40 family peptidase [Streptomyces sp. NBS 14/10]KAK1180084.1 C40 family peptidase [Streptomyces sp. NBS 14/10]NUS82367.1 C40 family peptidase [Streptomyces sp.]
MSQTAHIPSHRKPRRAASSTRALRAGVTGGFLTLAVAGAAAPALAAESAAAETTLEMPTLGDTLASTAAQSADATQQAASDYQLQAQQDQAAAKAKTAAKKAKVEADRKEREAKEAARKAAARRAAQEKAERASRTAERTSLSTATSKATSNATSTATKATGNAATLINFLKAQLGKAYVLGSSGPSSYDCSGLTQAAFNQIGISLPRVSQDQSSQGTAVSLDNLQPGDLLYWGGRGSAYHVGVYIGDGKFIGAQNPSTGIVERPLSYDPPTGAVRLL